MKVLLKIISMVCAALMVQMVKAADPESTQFPDVGGTHDISSPAAWGLSSMSELTTFAKFSGANKIVYVASNDVTFAGVIFQPNNNYTATFDLRNGPSGLADDAAPRVVTVNGNYLNNGKGATNVFYGGVWNFNGIKDGFFPRGSYSIGKVMTTRLEDGVVVTNLDKFSSGAYGGGISYLTLDGSRVYAKKMSIDYYKGGAAEMTIKGGSRVILADDGTTKQSLQSDSSGTGPGNRLLITGTGSALIATNGTGQISWGCNKGTNVLEVADGGLFSATGSVFIGVSSSPAVSYGNLIRVATNGIFDCGDKLVVGASDTSGGNLLDLDGGSASARSLLIGDKGSSNVVRITHGGSLSTGADASYIKNAAGADGYGRLEILEGGIYSATGSIYLGPYASSSPNKTTGIVPRSVAGHPNCTIVVSNGVFNSAQWPFIGFCAQSTNAEFRVAGPDARMNIEKTGNVSMFSWAPYCKFVVDGAAYTNTTATGLYFAYNIGAAQFGERVEIVNGGEIYTDGAFGIASGSYATSGNTVYVGDRSTLSASSISLNSMTNTLVVSNGTVIARTGDFNMAVTSETILHTNNTIVLQGDCPRLRCSNGKFRAIKGSTIRFELPETGYAGSLATDDDPVVQAAEEIWMDPSGKLEFVGLDKLIQSRRYGNNRLVLFSAPTLTMDVPIASARATLPAGVSLKKVQKGDDTQLILRLPGTQGLLLLVR